MDSDHSSDADSDEQYGTELLHHLRSMRFFNRADNIQSAKKLDLPSNSEITQKYRAPSEICIICRAVIKIISKITSTGRTFDAKYYPTYATVKSSAENGCGICSIFFREFRLERQDEDGSNKKSEIAWISATGSSFTWGVTIPWLEGDPNPEGMDMEDGDSEAQYCFKANMQSFLAASQNLDYDSLVPNTRDALPLCNIWFQNCQNSHIICGLPQSDSARTIPAAARLIEVSNGQPRLCLSQELKPNSPYAALSHRWGSLHFTTLKKDNINSFREQIPLDALTKTFRDAIQICKYLNVPYLWIDSLCIIQDSYEDWAIQSALMAHIYGECDLNIAATSAEDGDVGCFFDRPRDWTVQIRPLPDGKDLIYDCLPSPLINPNKDVLNQRGWVVQERYLSRRTLHFTSTQVFWECDEGPACETCPGGNPVRASPFCEYELKRRGIKRSDWDKIVSLYSAARLTQPSDRLIAVEGLARALQANTNDQYVAGMWKEWIERQLAWSPSEEFRPIATVLAPSWSWASGIDPVSLPLFWHDGKDNRATHIALHDLQVEYSSENTFRDVKSALIRLRCSHLLHAVLEPIQDSPDVYYKASFGGQRFDNIYLKIDCHDTAEKAQTILAYVLVIDESNGILLKPTAKAAGQYQRIGSYYSFDVSFIKAVAFADCIEQRDLDAFSGILEDDDGNEIYIIDLV